MKKWRKTQPLGVSTRVPHHRVSRAPPATKRARKDPVSTLKPPKTCFANSREYKLHKGDACVVSIFCSHTGQMSPVNFTRSTQKVLRFIGFNPLRNANDPNNKAYYRLHTLWIFNKYIGKKFPKFDYSWWVLEPNFCRWRRELKILKRVSQVPQKKKKKRVSQILC